MDKQKELETKIAEFRSLELAKSHLEKLEFRITDLHKKIQSYQRLLEKEYKDIEQLEKLSMRALFEKLLGDKEAQLEKERQEYLEAALKHNECKKSLDLLLFEKDLLVKKLKSFATTKSQLHYLIRQRESGLMVENELARQLISDVNTKIDECIAFKRELNEAIVVGIKVVSRTKKINDLLQQVVSWGQYTLSAPDMQIRKMSFINQARDQAYGVKQLLQQFEDELFDIYDDQNMYIQSSVKTFRFFIDSFFDNLISDWIMLMKIRNAIYSVVQVHDKTARIVQSLQHELKTTDVKMKNLKEKKEKIIIELN